MPKPALSIVELGGYPNFVEVFANAGFDLTVVRSMRKAIAYLKQRSPQVILTEFNFQSDFRDRTSSLESLLGTVQLRCPNARLIVMYDREAEDKLQRLLDRDLVYAKLPFPITTSALQELLSRLNDNGLCDTAKV